MQGLEAFFLIGTIIFIGFFASVIFERTKVSDVLILMLVGIIIGEFLKVQYGEVRAIFEGAAPIIGTIALIVILFDGGINLNIFRAFSELSTATWFTLVNFALTTIFSALLVFVFFGWPIVNGLLLGVVIGGTSSAMVMGVLSKISAHDETKMILALESALTDALCVVFAITIISLSKSGNVDASFAANQLFGAFSIAAVMATVAAIAWIKIMYRSQGKPFGYMLSIAVVFLLYSAVEAVNANGAIAVLVFGLLLGNWNELGKLFRSSEAFELDSVFKTFQAEVTFFIRTFFFVYLGIVFSLDALKITLPEWQGGTEIAQIAYSAGIWLLQFAANVPVTALLLLGLLVLARAIGTKILLKFNRQLVPDRALLIYLMPRDLAAAVLATLPATSGIHVPNLVNIVFLLILLTNIVATLGVLSHQQGKKAVPRIVAQN